MPPIEKKKPDVTSLKFFKVETAVTINDRRPRVDIGKAGEGFHPSFTVRAWNDTSCTLYLSTGDHSLEGVVPSKSQLNERDHVKISRPDLEHSLYAKPIDDDENKNAFEWEIILKQKPAKNVFEYRLTSNNLRFSYQPALTQEEIADGDHRPENVVGSYAVYHKTKRHTATYADGSVDDYKTGKAFHIYRPEAVDALGKKTWCELLIDVDAEIFRVTVPQKFLDTATYPITIDPTWGYTTAGASGKDASLFMRLYEIDGVAGDLTDWHCYTLGQTYADDYKIALYDETTGSADALLWSGQVTEGAASDEWNTNTLTLTISSGQTYWTAFIERITDGPWVAYDTDVAWPTYDVMRVDDGSGWTWPDFPDPCEPRGSTSTNKLSIYFDYTASGVTVTPDAITMVVKTVDPTVDEGADVTPDAISCIVSTTDPTVDEGADVTPDAITCVVSTTDPAVDEGATITPDAITCVLSTTDPTVAQGSITVTPDAISMVVETVDPTVDEGATITPDAITTRFSLAEFGSRSTTGSGVYVAANNLILGKYVSAPIDADVAVMYIRAYKWATDDTTLTGVIYDDNADAPDSLIAVSRNTVVAGNSDLMTVHQLHFDLARLSANTYYWIGVQASVENAGIVTSNTSSRRAIASDTLPIDSTFGGTTSNDAAPDVWIEYIDVTIGSLSLTPDAITEVLSTTDPTVTQGSLTITPDPISCVLLTTDPSVSAGGDVNVTPDAITMVVSTSDPSVDEGASIASGVVSMILATIDPTITLSSITITPDARSFVMSTTDPSVTISGAVEVTPDAITFILNTTAPLVNDSQLFTGMQLTGVTFMAGDLDSVAVTSGTCGTLGVRSGKLSTVEIEGVS